MDPEKPKTLQDALLEGRDEILEAKPLFARCPMKDAAEEHIVLGNYHHIVKTTGRLGKEEYVRMFAACAEEGDFHDLAVLFHESEVARREQYLSDHPDLPEQGDPGRAQVRSAIAVSMGALEGIRTVKKRNGKVPVHLIGSPSFREQPDWLIAIDQSGMRMQEVYDFLEKKGLPQTPTHDRQVEGVQGEVKGRVDEVI